ncbi:MAG: DUF669 domain-containing protein [Pseudomonadota bacterium]
MVDISGVHDTAEGEFGRDSSPIPAGEYVSVIAQADKRDAKRAGNAYINLEFEVVEGEHSGRRFWNMLNLWNDNAQAVEIANRDLNSICNACGKLRQSVRSTDELIGIPMIVKLGIRQQDGYDPQNVTKGFAPAQQGATPAQAQSSLPPAGEKRPPWKRAG